MTGLLVPGKDQQAGTNHQRGNGSSHKIIIDKSHSRCGPVLEYVINNPGCRVLDYQLHLGLHRGNPKNLEKRLEVSDCFEILCFGRYITKEGNQYYPLPKSWVVKRFAPGLDPVPLPSYGRE